MIACPAVKAFFRNELTRLFLFVVLCLILAAIFSPHLYAWGKTYAAENAGKDLAGWHASIVRSMGRADLARYFDRIFLASALILLYPFIRSLKDKSRVVVKPPFKSRINPGRQGWKDLFIGFIYATGYMAIMLMLLTKLGWVTLQPEAKPLSSAMLSSLLIATNIAIIEEWVFRGVLFALLLRSLKPTSAIVGLSLFFASVHFLKPHTPIADPSAPEAGFELLGQIGIQFLNPQFFIGVLLTLFTVGLILVYARHKTGYLWLSIGLHAGWVFCMKMFSTYTVRSADVSPWMYGSDIRQGLLPMLFVSLTGIAVFFYLRPKQIPIPIQKEK